MAECQAVLKNGRSCGAHALRGSQFCYMHDPGRAGERAAARKLGGLRRGSHAGDTDSLPEKVRTIENVLSLLDYTRQELTACDNGIPRARALIQLSGAYLQALEVGEVEERIKALEEKINVR